MKSVVGAVCISVLVLTGAAACGSAEEAEVVQAPTVTAAVPTLPDGIPLPVGASIASGPDSSKQAGARGWSAVVLAAPDADVSAITASISQQLQELGWTDQAVPTPDAGTSISATRSDGDTSSWLDVNITPPLPGGGSAVTYRFATGDALFGKGGALS